MNTDEQRRERKGLLPWEAEQDDPTRKAKDWTAPTYSANWSDFGGAWATVKYCKDATGRVWLRGMAKKSIATVAGETLFTLPTVCRPAADEYFAVNSNGAFGTIFITAGGAVNLGVGSNVYVSLSGISFDTV